MTVTYAGFWKRFAAGIIDGIIIQVVIILVVTGYYNSDAVSQELMSGASQEQIDGFARGLGSLIGFFSYWVYFAAMESSSLQATLGKMAFRIKVTDVNGFRVSFARASGRHFGKLSGMPLGMGILLMALFATLPQPIFVALLLLSILTWQFPVAIVPFTAKKQGLHDMMARCLVVNK